MRKALAALVALLVVVLAGSAEHASAFAPVALGSFFSGMNRAAAAPGIQVLFENESFATLAVDHTGIAYGKSTLPADPTKNSRLYRSADEGRTWNQTFDFPAGSNMLYISVLSDNTLLAHVNYLGSTRLFRSADGGRTWAMVFTFPAGITTLTSHSITDDGLYVYVGSYIPSGTSPNYVWRSADDGATWSVVRASTSHRHIHFVQADPFSGYLYVGYGDSNPQSAIERSRDHGLTWDTPCPGSPCTAVDIAFDPSGFAVFGQDHVYENAYIVRLDLATGTLTRLAQLPGPSYSAFTVGGVWLIGETREPRGTVYDPADLNLHLFASGDGARTFADVFQRPYRHTTGFERLMVQFSYSNGDFPIQISGYGTIVAHVAGVTGNSPPTVGITAPVAGADYQAPAQITLTANAADSDGLVTKVEFFAGSTLLGSDSTSPYSFSWSNVPAGSYRLTARATDDLGAMTTSAPVDVTVTATSPPPPSGTNLALGKPATASSIHSPGYEARKANDGSTSTRWASIEGRDGDWWQVDLGSTQTIASVNWEGAYASRYQIQTSTNGSTFTTVADVTNTSPGTKTTTFTPTNARYVRIVGVTRGTPYGISIWEVQVFGDSSSSPPPPPSGTNLALGKPATASSVEASAYAAGKANDGSTSTRWASLVRNGEWWQVDLGSNQTIASVSVNWETAYASRYQIQTSTDGSTFTTVADVTNTSAGTKTTTFSSTSARYVRILGLTRGTPYGISIWEAQVFGA